MQIHRHALPSKKDCQTKGDSLKFKMAYAKEAVMAATLQATPES
jgi:hypothetical protein